MAYWAARRSSGDLGLAGNKHRLRWAALSTGASLAAFFLASSLGASPAEKAALTPPADYQANCAACHGEGLTGGPFGPPLVGGMSGDRWSSIDMLTQYISQSMPPANPGGLSKESYRRLAEYLFAANGLGQPAAESAGEGTSAETAPPDKAVSEHAASGGVGSAVQNEDATYQAVIAAREQRLAALTPIGDDMLANPPAGDWLHWRRTYDGQGFSPLDQINQSNAAKLTVAWAKALPAGSNGITPLVHDGVMFINSAGMVLALDVKSGDTLWRYSYDATVTQAGPPVTQPRSMAAFENLLYVPTLDNHVIALDMKTGKPVWDHLIEKTNGLLRTSTGPIIAKGKLIQGTTGCFDNVPAKRGCFIVGLDARTGTELWRFHTIPYGDEPGANSWNGAPLEERIGGGIWGTGTYDPVNNLVYFGVGQSYHIAPLLGGNIADVKRPALFTDSTLALNPDTGKLVWYYQHMARDVWDLDWSFERTIMDLDWKGSRHHVVATMGKLGILDVLDAKTGKYLFSYDLGMQNLVTSIDPKTGHKTTDPKMEPKAGERVDICPFAIGVRNWPALSYDTARGRLYVPAAYSCMAFEWNKGNKGLDILYSPRPRTDADGNNGRFVAIDVAGQKTSWESSFRAPPVSAVLATAGGVVFNGARDREFRAFDSDTGNILWKMKLDNIPAGSPIAFADGGHEYVAITTGGGHANDVTRSSQTPEVESAAKGTTLWVFELSSR